MLGWFKAKTTQRPEIEKKSEWVEQSPDDLYAYFKDTTGIHFDQKKEITTSKLLRFAQEHQSHSFGDLLVRLQSDPALFQKLVNFLTVNETYFFREINQIEYMVSEIKKKSEAVRILCAPGSTGEEPYSIAMALCEAGISMNHISIVSIDINTEAIVSARQGVYGKRSLHRIDQPMIDRYFTLENEKYSLKDMIKQSVEFKAMNLFDFQPLELGKFDYIFSRNMLIYFDAHKTALAIKKLASLTRTSSSLLFFGHADIVTPPAQLLEHHQGDVKFYTYASNES
jgi:chemotaxis protein methyltransferase CheR